ncbi:malectin domain-containing carbohydrate-binding protein [Poritiphilus flavus]|uniref:DUF5018 domain-containing protein n=1 Tax=Poritiphilus flavus TaxID=2697053 RepID=A0A6L9EE93_9FLAO|nr:malectin domain-containing carbohydrate-binding protein [Poritiphilus flavus]NAS13037.1 DUF5018 domain-containing protein [Poritiphilus flavus]
MKRERALFHRLLMLIFLLALFPVSSASISIDYNAPGSLNYPVPAAFELRLNCGGGQLSYGDEVYLADDFFIGGRPASSTNAAIGGTDQDELYRSGRTATQNLGGFQYAIPVDNGTYEIKLHFAEIYWTGSGQRVFSVEVEGNPILLDFDITAEVGARHAVIKTANTSVTDGLLNIEFSANVNRPLLSALEILGETTLSTETDILSFVVDQQTGSSTINPTDHTIAIEVANGTDLTAITPAISLSEGATVVPAPGTTTDFSSGTATYAVTAEDGLTTQDWVVNLTEASLPTGGELHLIARINCGGGQMNLGYQVFEADTFFNGGRPSSGTNAEIGGTNMDQLYHTGRTATQNLGGFQYALPVIDGNYELRLHFAEIYWTGSGQRVFSVAVEGTPMIVDLDITDEVGARNALVKTINTAVADGILNIEFSASVNGPLVSALEVFSLNSLGTDTDILSFAVDQQTGIATINPTDHTIAVEVAHGTDLSAVAPAITLSEGATVVPGSGATTDFSSGSVTYSVTAEDGVTTQDWVVSLTEAAPPTGGETNLIARINSCGGQVSFGDEVFEADTYFIGGRASSNPSAAIGGTDRDELYRTGRTSTENLGGFQYAIPLDEGNYEIKLHFAEIYWTGSGQRVFSVEVEGTPMIIDLDITDEVGARHAVIKTVNTAVTDGMLNIVFTASINRPTLSAMEIFGSGEVVVPPPAVDCSWNDLANISYPHIEGQSANVNGRLYLAGGYDGNIEIFNSTEIYDIDTDTWSIGTPMLLPVTHGAMVAVNDEFWIIGGFVGNNPGPVTDRVQIYHTATDSWSEGPALPEKRGSGAATFLNGKIHFFGGLLEDRITDSEDHYVLDINDLAAGWQSAAPLPNPRNHLSAATIDGLVYAIGGQFGHDNGVDYVSLLHAYDPATDSWSQKADLLYDRSHFEMATAVHGDKILIAGGRGEGFVVFNSLTQYDSSTDTWSELCELPEAILTPALAVSSDRLIMAGGSIGGNHNVSYKTRWLQLEPNSAEWFVLKSRLAEPYFNEVVVFPNPSQGRFEVSLPVSLHAFDLVVRDMSGQVVLTQKFRNSNKASFTLDSPAGLYLLQLRLESGEEIVRKIVKL